MKKKIKVISNKINKIIKQISFEIKDCFIWLKNRKSTQEEIIRDEIQYTKAMVKITEMQDQIKEIESKLKESQKEIEHQRKLKETYLRNCKNLTKKIEVIKGRRKII